jgi:dephospho-CoA kinase
MIKIGVTGGIGMGKSTSGLLLSARGVPVVDTDDLAREEARVGSEGFRGIVDAFGVGILSADGEIDRRRLADLVFFDDAARSRLEAILHPRIASQWRNRVAGYERSGAPIVVVLIPLLFERQYQEEFTCTLTVACSRETQFRRLLDRGWSRSQIDARNAAQMPIFEKMANARFVIWTEGSLQSHETQLNRGLQSLAAA